MLGLSLNASAGQAAQVVGYLAGAAVAAVSPTAALLLNAATFGLSALLVRFGVQDREPTLSAAHRTHLLRETGEGFRIVFGTPVLRAIALLVFSAMLFSIVPEGLAAAWAGERSGSGLDPAPPRPSSWRPTRSASSSAGCWSSRLVRPGPPAALMRPLAVLAPLALVPALLDPPAAWWSPCSPRSAASRSPACCPTANGLFVRALPNGLPGPRLRRDGHRRPGDPGRRGAGHRPARRALLAARWWSGVWSAAGVVLMLVTALRWPAGRRSTRRDAADTGQRPPPRRRPGAGRGRPAPAPRPAARRAGTAASGTSGRGVIRPHAGGGSAGTEHTWQDGAVTAAGEPDRLVASTTLFEAVGGEPTFRKLVDEFYAGVATDPLLRPAVPGGGPRARPPTG